MIRTHEELDVYKMAFEAGRQIFRVTKQFPKEETYALTDQIRRSSRSVYANIAEAWRKRRYEGSFCVKLNDAEGEAAETQSWIKTAIDCGYIIEADGARLYHVYDNILGKLVMMIAKSQPWLMTK